MTEENQTQAEAAAEENKLVEVRRQKLRDLQAKGIAYPSGFKPSHFTGDIQEEYAAEEKATLEEAAHKMSVGGRVIRNRGAFMVIQDMTGQLQLYINRKVLSEDELALIKTLDLGDIIGAEGTLSKSNKGDLYIDMTSIRLLTKSLRPLPDKHKGLADTEMCYRQRYVDLIVNEETRKRFVGRSKLMAFTREFFNSHRFMEVETPMLQSIPGGASARPFETHHNALDMPMYLRIAPELFLKRLVVGGMDRVYEINRNFRNEGVSTRHNPEFTMLEFYQAFATYEDLIKITEDYIRGAAKAVTGSTQIQYQGVDYDLDKPFDVISMKDSIVKYGEGITADQLESLEAINALAQKLGVKTEASWGVGKHLQEIFDVVAEPNLIHPTFITEYPKEVSPLARLNDDNPEITDRFEFFIGGREIGNGFSELNDSEDQAARFKKQVESKEAGDDEAMHYDADYITALEYGLPPTAGQGIGLDRLAMFLTDAPSIRDVILFPTMRPL
ncbi:MAG: lysine--tRNA ligase [Pseudomonadota bacterium]|nr:lysine--tRNA ligase [Pseudomonadota bacterium]